jgi:type IV secretory pathway component VirB8
MPTLSGIGIELKEESIHLNGYGFIITAYRTNKIKRGDLIWKA